MAAYDRTLSRVETYFDQTATETWARLTSDAPVSKVRATVRAGRDRMRQILLGRLPRDLTGARVLDAGCGAGQMTIELAERGADVVGIDVSPSLISIAAQRLPANLRGRVTLQTGDMASPELGRFDHVIAMDSLIYYDATDIGEILAALETRISGVIAFTVAPRTPLLMGMWYAGKLFPQSDRSPVMIPHTIDALAAAATSAGLTRGLRPVEQVTQGFYISRALEVRA